MRRQQHADLLFRRQPAQQCDNTGAAADIEFASGSSSSRRAGRRTRIARSSPAAAVRQTIAPTRWSANAAASTAASISSTHAFRRRDGSGKPRSDASSPSMTRSRARSGRNGSSMIFCGTYPTDRRSSRTQAQDRPQQRRLAGPVRTDQPAELGPSQPERHIPQDCPAGKGDAQVLHHEHGVIQQHCPYCPADSSSVETLSATALCSARTSATIQD